LAGAQNNPEFDKGNALYNDGDYKAAIQAYEVILEKGLHSAELYYNLANCFYKLNKVGPTIYFYEKALMLDPKDTAILNNLAFAEKMRIDKIELIPEVGLVKLIKNIVDLFKLDTWAFVCIGFMLAFVGFFIAYYLNQSAKKKRLFFVLG
jgi:tetratricopeptide (TPR) repeat protein